MVHVRALAVECLACMCVVVSASPEVHSGGFREVSWWLPSGGGFLTRLSPFARTPCNQDEKKAAKRLRILHHTLSFAHVSLYCVRQAFLRTNTRCVSTHAHTHGCLSKHARLHYVRLVEPQTSFSHSHADRRTLHLVAVLLRHTTSQHINAASRTGACQWTAPW
jgi:hypothetical protein